MLPVILIVALVIWLINRQKTTMAPPASAPPGTRYCSKCGQPMEPGGSFCRSCGAQT
jgi:predicted amidophosphoribosyltransferase